MATEIGIGIVLERHKTRSHHFEVAKEHVYRAQRTQFKIHVQQQIVLGGLSVAGMGKMWNRQRLRLKVQLLSDTCWD